MARIDRSHQVCFLTDGSAIGLASRVAFGGEGSVYPIDGDDNIVAKIYHDPPDAEKIEKLVAMITHIDKGLDSFTAWPKGTVHSTAGGPCIGFTMTSAVGFKEAHKLYSPRDRKAEFDHADWRFLVRAASNIAKAFASVHSAGHVIGDVNHSSVMIGGEATCRLIDCDSYQITIEGKTFPCRVGEPLHTAPELFGVPLHSTPRTPNHDAFGLAVLAFELLFMGKHPFAGAFLGQGDPSLEEKIRQFRFAYAPNAAELLVSPPADSLTLEYLPWSVAEMFTQAFSPTGAHEGRPSARDWASALDALTDQLQTCAQDPAHSYFADAPDCPWCRIERATGATLFNLGPAFRPNKSATFDSDTAWKAIESVRPPGAKDLPTVTGRSLPSEPARRSRARRRLEWMAAFVVLSILALGVLAIAPGNPDAWGGFAVLTAIAGFFLERRRAATIREAEFRLIGAESQLHVLITRWQTEAEPDRFTTLFEELKSKRHEMMSMTYSRAQKMSELERSLEPRLRRRHMERHRIAQHPIEGVNLSRCVTLASYGVESAADITETALTGIPGVGPTLRNTLLKWRRQVEKGFRFDAADGIPPEEIEELDRELAERRRVLEADLALGANSLSLVKSQIQSAQQELAEPLHVAMLAFEVAKADRRAMAGL